MLSKGWLNNIDFNWVVSGYVCGYGAVSGQPEALERARLHMGVEKCVLCVKFKTKSHSEGRDKGTHFHFHFHFA